MDWEHDAAAEPVEHQAALRLYRETRFRNKSCGAEPLFNRCIDKPSRRSLAAQPISNSSIVSCVSPRSARYSFTIGAEPSAFL